MDLKYITNHVFLPPQLPQKDDHNLKRDLALLGELKAALLSFKAYFSGQHNSRWQTCTDIVSKMLDMRDQDGGISSEALDRSLKLMRDGHVLSLEIRGQNAGLIIRRLGKQYTFESFELSPTTQAVMSTKGRLRRCFPGPAIAISEDRVADPNFRAPFAQFLAQLDAETPVEAWPIASKSGSAAIEIRETVHPKFVTEMTTGILRGMGQPFHVNRIWKNTRDEVLWHDTLKPWRRSSLWLLLRVTLQTSLVDESDARNPHKWYKALMIFFMAHVLQCALRVSEPSDILFVMAAKISRRILKLDDRQNLPWLEYVQLTVAAVHQELSRRWRALEQNPDPLRTQKAWNPRQLRFLQDTRLSAHSLRPYLVTVAARLGFHSSHKEFKPGCPARIQQQSRSLPSLSLSKMGFDDTPHLFLADLELWVQDRLNDWLDPNIFSQYSCKALTEVMDEYIAIASRTYADKPEDMSVMFLTLLDLWVALDKCAIYRNPLLKDYDPGFTPSLFDSLLLPKKTQMKRLDRIEQYLTERRHRSNPNLPSIFRDVSHRESFAVRFFDDHPKYQRMRQEIEAVAENERAAKKQEYLQKRQQYQQLIAQSDAMVCEYTTRRKKHRETKIHSKSCEKCDLNSRAQKLTITIHEWPLPELNSAAKAAVFELDVPDEISRWRDVTYCILVDICSPDSKKIGKSGHNLYPLRTYTGLSKYNKSSTGRLQLASAAKPFTVSHYGNGMKISQATEASLCVNNGLQYSMHDSRNNQWTTDLPVRYDISAICRIQLSSGLYEPLQFALDSTTHTSNQVISKQAICPPSITLHEFYAFAMLRSGHRLQWRNIARELVVRVINFGHEETHDLIIQAIWQAGPSLTGSVCRESHIDLEELEFGLTLLSVIEEAISTIEGNWQGVTAVRTLVAVATRLLSVSPHLVVENNCYCFLKRARNVALGWTRDLANLLHEGRSSDDQENLKTRALEVALACHATFDVETHHMPGLLSSDADVALIVECSIVIHDRCPAETDKLPTFMIALLRRHWRLSHLLEPMIRNCILASSGGVNNAIQELWAGYMPGKDWTALESPNERWLATTTSDKDGLNPMAVHYNVLDGSLLVNGSPLSRLPRSYEMHQSYRKLFHEKILDVVPSTMGGMLFETRRAIHGHQVHFAMYDSELIVRTQRGEDVHELLPSKALQGDFPHEFIQGHAQWLDFATKFIEWRPLEDPWTTRSQNWHMQPDHQGDMILARGSFRLIDVRSATANAICRVLSPLETATHINIIVDCKSQKLEIRLPRLKLDFSLSRNDLFLKSKQFRGMIVDQNQSFGSLSGLVNKLVLVGVGKPARVVIVPHGDVSFASANDHVRVEISTASESQLTYHSFRIDTQLGRLVDNNNLKSRLFRIYLHAVTAHCMVDHLTGTTGTEEALSGLRAASTRSFLKVKEDELELLELIARLTPRRVYYPPHLHVMQEVQWSSLPPLSQHNSFYNEVVSILSQIRSFHIFQDEIATLPTLDANRATFLYERAGIRDSWFRVHSFGAEDHTTEYDVAYDNRDCVSSSVREANAFRTSKLVDQWSSNPEGCKLLLHDIESWNASIVGVEMESDLALGFDLKWLDLPAKFLPSYWCTLHNMLSTSTAGKDKYKIMIFLATLSYSQHMQQDIVHTLLAFATVPELRAVKVPNCDLFQLAQGYEPKSEKLIRIIKNHTRPFKKCPESSLPDLPLESRSDANERRLEAYGDAKAEQIDLFATGLIDQWPEVNISSPRGASYDTYISVAEAVEESKVSFQHWNFNSQFREYVGQIQTVLDSLSKGDKRRETYAFSRPFNSYCPRRAYISVIDLFDNPAPISSPIDSPTFDSLITSHILGTEDHSKLRKLLVHLQSRISGGYEQRYTEDLIESFKAYLESAAIETKLSPGFRVQSLQVHLTNCERNLIGQYETICRYLMSPLSTPQGVAQEAQMVPRLSPTILLSLLSTKSAIMLSKEWKTSLVQYGISIVTAQRARRLVASAGHDVELLAELQNCGHQGWDPAEFPEWLLLEIESDILIRREQAEIAREMISPTSGSNSIMQLNMGLGKSSVIVPIAGADLADGKKLVRVVVLKPLVTQMFHSLVSKLGSLLNRRIYYMPISRSLNLNEQQARQIRALYEECMSSGGILLAQPEHLLSFELMGFERLLRGDFGVGNALIQTQRWLQCNSRDILDESDEILSVRFELIYTMGTQCPIELSPDRWNIVQHVLGTFGDVASKIVHDYPEGLEVLSTDSGRFPRIRIMERPAGDKLLALVAQQICDNGLPGVPVWNFPLRVRTLLFKFITDPTMSFEASRPLQRAVFKSDFMQKSLLLLKGLFASGILLFAFTKKRWRVNYGLDLSRTMLAVPYHAKDIPAPRAEFSHPDASIVLTCLSYYYGGLSDQQLLAAFEALILCDHAQEEYEYWVKYAPALQAGFRQLIGINLSNLEQCTKEVFPFLRFAKGAVDFYMSHVVFPKEMKEFPSKLSASGWDIAQKKFHATTGFSGTNDSRYVLPLSISQCDLPQQLSTNAAVLNCLLRTENKFEIVIKTSTTECLDASILLQTAVQLYPPIRVIIDVGAQVLELQNREVVEAWLSRVPESKAQAAIYFDRHNELCVLSRDGTTESLVVSSFSTQMDQCLVYLDEAHTRGTDLKLPTNYRAMVTLGPALSKDRLVQACMRMRKLGKGQSIVFCGPDEIIRKILQSSGKHYDDIIDVADVLNWCISETFAYTKNSIPLWATQGLRYQSHYAAYSQAVNDWDEEFPVPIAELLLEKEAQTLEERYGVLGGQSAQNKLLRGEENQQLSSRKDQLDAIRAKCREFNLQSFNNATLQEEQERELSPENEREQQIELPPASIPCEHNVHRDLRRFVQDGVLPQFSPAFQPAFEAFSVTSAAQYFEKGAWPKDVLVTADFANTIHAPKGQLMDSFLRPVNWVISRKVGENFKIVVVSPFEAQELLPSIRQQNSATLHVYSPRLTISMRILEDLRFCAVPVFSRPWPVPPTVALLNMFAGQLYIQTYEDYISLCTFLGLTSAPPDDRMEVACDGFINQANREVSDHAMAKMCPFKSSPVGFLRVVTSLRRKGQSYTTSHMGRILYGELVKEKHFETTV